jgi:hypothetical protein
MIAKSSVTEMITRVIEILEWITHQMKLNMKLQETLTNFGKVLPPKTKNSIETRQIGRINGCYGEGA